MPGRRSKKGNSKSVRRPQILGHLRKSADEPPQPHAIARGKRRLAWDIIGPYVLKHPRATPTLIANEMGCSLERAKELLSHYHLENHHYLVLAKQILARPGKKTIFGVALELGISESETQHVLHQLIIASKKKKK